MLRKNRSQGWIFGGFGAGSERPPGNRPFTMPPE
jgi:hypothetical protein